jgi:hypothetical protein
MKSEIWESAIWNWRLLAGHHRRDPLTPDPLPKRGEGDKLSLGNSQSGRRGWSKRSSDRPRPFWGEGWGEGANRLVIAVSLRQTKVVIGEKSQSCC